MPPVTSPLMPLPHFGRMDQSELNIAADEFTILYILPDFIKCFSTAFPRIQLKLHNATGRDGMTMLRADEALALRPLDAYIPKRSYGVVMRRGKFLSPQARAFIDMIDPVFFTQHLCEKD